MRIAFIIPSLANKGPILVVKELTDYLVSAGIYCTVYYFDDKNEIKFNCLSKKISWFTIIDYSSYDIIHTHMFRPDAYGFFLSWIPGLRKKLISTIHNLFIEDLLHSYGKIKSVLGSILWRIFWSRFNQIVVLSNSARTYYLDYISEKKLNIVVNGRSVSFDSIDYNDIHLFTQLKSNRFKIIGTVASFNTRKGLDQVIDILAIDPTIVFIVVGDGEERKSLIDKAQRLNVLNRCYFIGPRINGHNYMPYFDIYLLPSRSEGVPLALLEAVSAKVPVVCSKIDVFQELFTKNEVSFFSLDDQKSLINSINYAFKNSEELVQNAYKKYLNNYTTERMTKNYLKIYNVVIKTLFDQKN